MNRRPYVVEAVSAVLGGGLGALVCGGVGFWVIDWQAGIGLTVIGAATGMVAGFFSGQLAMAALELVLLILLPSRRIYPAIGCVVGVIGATLQAQRQGYSSIEWLVALIVYVILTLVVCEICGALCTSTQRVNVSLELSGDPEER